MAVDTENIEHHTPRKKIRGCFSCGVIFAVVMIVIFFWGLWVVAATGLVEIPLMTRFAFTSPQPSHTVEIVSTSPESWIERGVLNQVMDKLTSSIEPFNSEISLTVPEGILTNLLRSSSVLIEDENVAIAPGEGQVAVVDEELEIFVPIKNTETAITLALVPSIENDELDLSVESLYIGSLHIPNFIVKYLVNSALELGTDKISESIDNLITMSELRVTEKGLLIRGTIVPGAIRF